MRQGTAVKERARSSAALGICSTETDKESETTGSKDIASGAPERLSRFALYEVEYAACTGTSTQNDNKRKPRAVGTSTGLEEYRSARIIINTMQKAKCSK